MFDEWVFGDGRMRITYITLPTYITTNLRARDFQISNHAYHYDFRGTSGS